MQSIKKFLIKILDYLRYHAAYSQDGEDMILKSFYETLPKGYKGFYVDVGAHHPVRFSNTYYFYNKGWRGLNIDATPGSMKAFRWMRNRDINLEAGVGKESGTMTFYCFDDPALNSFSKELSAERASTTRYRIIREVSVPVYSLKELLDKYLPAGTQIDFLTIDVEGLDFEVLSSNDWDKYRPAYVLVEDNEVSLEQYADSLIFQFLHKKQYQLVAKTKRTYVFEKK